MVDDWRADLHTHSTCSDGSLSPIELVHAAKKAGLSGLSITDHDCVDAYDQLGYEKGNEKSSTFLTLLTGIELTTQLGNESIHLLAYGFDPNNPDIQGACRERRINRRERFFEMRSNLRKMGLSIPENMDMPDRILGRPQIAAELVKLGICKSFQEAFQKYLGDESPAYVPGKAFPVEEGIELLKAAGAWVILAHPMLVRPDSCSKVIQMPLDGVEAFYGRYHHKAAQWLQLAQKKGWVVTGGSDFHGEARPDIKLGQSWVDQGVFNKLQRPPQR